MLLYAQKQNTRSTRKMEDVTTLPFYFPSFPSTHDIEIEGNFADNSAEALHVTGTARTPSTRPQSISLSPVTTPFEIFHFPDRAKMAMALIKARKSFNPSPESREEWNEN